MTVEWPTEEDANDTVQKVVRDMSLSDLLALATYVDSHNDTDLYEVICDRIVEIEPNAFLIDDEG